MKVLATLFTLLLTQATFADIPWQTYNVNALKVAQDTHKKIILGFHKQGCSTCRSQEEALERAGIKDGKNVAFLKVERENDSHTQVYEKFGFSSRQWSAIVLLDNKKEIARIDPGITSGDQVTNLISKLK